MSFITGTPNGDTIQPGFVSPGVTGFPRPFPSDEADTIDARGGNDTVSSGGGNDLVNGNGGNDSINGGGGNDTLNGNAGNDTLNGGTGNDTLNGNIGNDTLNGGTGNDTLNGGTGNDTLNGGTGNDSMRGGPGNDTYELDSLADTIAEFAGQGTDLVFSSVSTNGQLLPANVENLTLTGSAGRGDGNALNNTITGTDRANSLYGYGGNDTLIGQAGNDDLIGGSGNDSLIGGSGNDRLTGGLGDDTLTGDRGRDTFIFNSLSEGIDTIKDFQVTQDILQVSRFGFGGIVSSNQFTYDRDTGALFFDPLGPAGLTQFAALENKPVAFNTALDIIIV